MRMPLINIASLMTSDLNHKPVNISPREHDVLRLIADERTSAQIAHCLCISTETVHSHRKNMMYKLEAKNAVGLVIRAIQMGILTI